MGLNRTCSFVRVLALRILEKSTRSQKRRNQRIKMRNAEAKKFMHRMICEEEGLNAIPLIITCKYCEQEKTKLDIFQSISEYGTTNPDRIEATIACLDCGEKYIKDLHQELSEVRESNKRYKR